MAEHTPLPWKVFKSPEGIWGVKAVYHQSGARMTTWPAICNAGAQPNEANAAFIVEACNAYASLRADLSHAKGEIDRLRGAAKEAQRLLFGAPLQDVEGASRVLDAALSPLSTGSAAP
jgi:hypothetical protein